MEGNTTAITQGAVAPAMSSQQLGAVVEDETGLQELQALLSLEEWMQPSGALQQEELDAFEHMPASADGLLQGEEVSSEPVLQDAVTAMDMAWDVDMPQVAYPLSASVFMGGAQSKGVTSALEKADASVIAAPEAAAMTVLHAASQPVVHAPAALTSFTQASAGAGAGALAAVSLSDVQTYSVDHQAQKHLASESPVGEWQVQDAQPLASLQLVSRSMVERMPVAGREGVSAEASAVPVQKGHQALVQALAQRIQIQQFQGADVATVRLDPPQMGSLEIRIRQDVQGIQVQMHASHSEVGRQLVTVIENLRQELLQRSSDANVTVTHSRSTFAGSQQGEQQRQGRHGSDGEPQIGQALQAWDAESLT